MASIKIFCKCSELAIVTHSREIHTGIREYTAVCSDIACQHKAIYRMQYIRTIEPPLSERDNQLELFKHAFVNLPPQKRREFEKFMQTV